MRILFIPAIYLPHMGGVETVVRELATRFHAADHPVAIVTNRHPRHLPSRERIDDLDVRRLFFVFPRLRFLLNSNFKLWLGAFLLFPLTFVQLALVIRRFKPNVVNVHFVGSQALHIWLLHRLRRFPLVVSLHGADIDYEPHQSRFNRWLLKALLQRADSVTACSQDLLNMALEIAPAIREKAQVLHNGVNVEVFLSAEPYAHPRPYVTVVGRLAPHKGVDFFLKAYAKTKPMLAEPVDVLLIGDGHQRAELGQQVKTLELVDSVHFLGNLPREQVASVMSGANLVVIPSRREPFGIVALEALATGRPIISTNIGGLPEALEGAEVTFVAPDDVDALAQALISTLDSHTANTRNQANQQLSLQRSWTEVAQTYLTLLTQSCHQILSAE